MSFPNMKKAGRGFTLVEMAIVLVIIGIILAGVMKGRDIVRGAQVKQFSQQFAQKWATIAQTYYDKTGQFLNDGAVNGNTAGGTPDGIMDGAITTASLLTTLRDVGIEPCTLIKSKMVDPIAGTRITAASTVCEDNTNANILNPWQTMVDGEYANSRIVEVDLVGLNLTLAGGTIRRNCVVLYGVPIDVAIGLDTAIDGKEDGNSGSCLCRDDAIAATATPAALVANAAAIVPVDWAAGGVATNAGGIQDVIIILDY